MLKKRFGEDFWAKINDNLEVKANEPSARREHKGKRRQGGDKR